MVFDEDENDNCYDGRGMMMSGLIDDDDNNENDNDDDGKTERNDDEKRDDVKWRRKISMIKLKIRGLRRQ